MQSRRFEQVFPGPITHRVDMRQDQIYDVVRAEIDRKRQRVVIGPWRVPTVSKLIPIGVGAAAVIAVLFIGSRFIGSPTSNVGGPASQSPALVAPSEAPASAAPSPISAPALTQTFTSAVHGISVSYPEGWIARAATEPWPGGGGPHFPDPYADVMYASADDNLILMLGSRPIGDSTPAEWIAKTMADARRAGMADSMPGCDGTAARDLRGGGGRGRNVGGRPEARGDEGPPTKGTRVGDADAVRRATAAQLHKQARPCAEMGSPLYAHLLERAAADCAAEGPVWQVLRDHAAPGRGDALALRFMAAVHRLVLQRGAPWLAMFYPSVGGSGAPDGAWEAFRAALVEHGGRISGDGARPCQTNEVGRAAAIAVGLLTVVRATGMPLRLREVGASARLNLPCDRFLIGGAVLAGFGIARFVKSSSERRYARSSSYDPSERTRREGPGDPGAPYAGTPYEGGL